MVLGEFFLCDGYKMKLDTVLAQRDLLEFWLAEKGRENTKLIEEVRLTNLRVKTAEDKGNAVGVLLDVCKDEKKIIVRNAIFIGGGVVVVVGVAAVIATVVVLQK